jgi:catechol 2,3-dioxygenase-like lactoylglutathione lyase family enzyme
VIGRLHHIVLDCPDPGVLADFYSALLGQPITYRSDDFWVVAERAAASGLGFQRARHHRPPAWPDPQSSQQIHLDVMVDDVTVAGEAVTRLGARPLRAPGVYTDPAGHPFCLIPRPAWAAAISPD